MGEAARGRSQRRTLLGGFVLVLAAAGAGVGWYLLTPAPVPKLPNYRITVSGGDGAVELAGAQGPVQRFSLGSRVDIVLRPDALTQIPIGVQSFLRSPQITMLVPGRFEPQPDGSLRLQGPANSVLPRATGLVDLIVVVYPEHYIDAVGAARIAEGEVGAPEGVRVLRVPIDLPGDGAAPPKPH